jgi:hypothetical protein
MALLVDKSDHGMIWLPDGDGVPDRKKHMIQSPKLTLRFFWNSHGFQLVDAMAKGEIFTAAIDIRNSLIEIIAQCEERSERRLVVHANDARPHTVKVTTAFCDDNFL